MATALAAQLASIAANSTNQLNLKAQRQAHSQSLIFEPQEAALQDFDTLYDICIKGFGELCLLDSRFSSFANSIFSEHSKTQERPQLTSAQNDELDAVLERFLHLVGSKILLQPAIQAVEWLVRRFRVHEYNTQCLVLTFLPYHTLPLFATLLSIIPKRLSPATKFLHPYVESLASPPRHTISYAATNNIAFFTAWNNYILKSCQQRCSSSSMISYWATIMTEAITGQLDQTVSGRREAQRQKEEDILLRILPIMGKGMAMKHAPDIRVGCYMILTVLVSRIDLDDAVLLSLIEAVVNGGTRETSHAELICIAVLVQQRDEIVLPLSVFGNLMRREGLVEDIRTLSERYHVDKLSFALASKAVQLLQDPKSSEHSSFIQSCIKAKVLTSSQCEALLAEILGVAKSSLLEPERHETLNARLADCVQEILVAHPSRSILEAAVKRIDIRMGQVEILLQGVSFSAPDDGPPGVDANSSFSVKHEERATYSSLKTNIVVNQVEEASFFSRVDTALFQQLATLFSIAARNQSDIEDFTRLPIFRSQNEDDQLLLSSFLARFAVSPSPNTPRAQAVRCLSSIVDKLARSVDAQCLLPYVLVALSDGSGAVRRAAVALTLSLSRLHPLDPPEVKSILLGKSNFYSTSRMGHVVWLTETEIWTLYHETLIPSLEECELDKSHISRLLFDALKRPLKQQESPAGKRRALKKTVRTSFLKFLCAHIVETPSYSAKYALLTVLRGVTKAGVARKGQILGPLLSAHLHMSEPDYFAACFEARLEPGQFARELTKVVTASDVSSHELLQAAIVKYEALPPSSFQSAIFLHVREGWNALYSEIQKSWADILFKTAVFPLEHTPLQLVENARETLAGVELSSDLLFDLLNRVPRLVEENLKHSPSAKRRKTAHGSVESKAEPESDDIHEKLAKTVLALEIIENSKDGCSSLLLPQLFQVLHDLLHCSSKAGSDMSYAQSLTMSIMTRIIKSATSSGASPIEQHLMRIDVVIDCFRSSGSPQVQHEALSLLSSLASYAPDLIVHSVMPIFTFMGNSVLRHDDERSAKIVNSTISSIIPPLIASFRKRTGGVLLGASELILSFAAAFEHIPSHRRLGLLTLLMKNLGEDYLYLLIVILIDRHDGNASIWEFCSAMIAQYSTTVQLRTIGNCLDFALDSFKPSPSKVRQILSDNKSRANDMTPRFLMKLPARLLKTQDLAFRVARTLRAEDEDAAQVRDYYSSLVKKSLQLLDQTKSNSSLQDSSKLLLDVIFNFLPLAESLRSLSSLLQHGSNDVRRQVLKSFEQRISAAKPGEKATADACLKLLPQLTLVLEDSSDASLTRLTVTCMDKITEKYGKRDLEVTVEVAKTMAASNGLHSQDTQMQALALLSFVTLVEVLRERLVPIMPIILPRSLDLLHNATMTRNQSLERASFSLFSSFFLYLPWMITRQPLEQFLNLSFESARLNTATGSAQARTHALDILANQTGAHECIQVLQTTWALAAKQGPNAIFEVLEMLEKVIEKHSKSTMVKEAPLLISLFQSIMDVRTSQDVSTEKTQLDAQQLERLESRRNEIMIKTIYKLNDKNFRPLFIQMVEWATTGKSKKDKGANTNREISWFSFLHHFFETLQSIVTTYATHVIDGMVDILINSSTSQPAATVLSERVLQTLYAMFEHDQDEFWKSPTRFAKISTPLLAQLELAPVQDSTSMLVPCITSFANAADSSDHLKAINSKLLEYLRSDNAKVRLTAARCEMSITESMGEEWLNLLPEMLPAISEALEDDDEDVEREVRRWAKKIEDVLGESLDDMLQ